MTPDLDQNYRVQPANRPEMLNDARPADSTPVVMYRSATSLQERVKLISKSLVENNLCNLAYLSH